MNNKVNNFRPAIISSAIALILLFVMPTLGTASENIIVGDFSASNLTGWKEKVFKNKTKYKFIESNIGTVLKADSSASASGMFREMKIDLTKTPCLSWSWKVDGVLDGLDETTKSGDDYPARVYVVFSDGLFFWQTRALNYVWSGGRAKGSSWPNAYTDRSINIAVQSGPTNVGKWVSQSRNVLNDYKRLVGEDIKQAEGIAIMTDTDDSKMSATAYYGDVKFTSSCS